MAQLEQAFKSVIPVIDDTATIAKSSAKMVEFAGKKLPEIFVNQIKSAREKVGLATKLSDAQLVETCENIAETLPKAVLEGVGESVAKQPAAVEKVAPQLELQKQPIIEKSVEKPKIDIPQKIKPAEKIKNPEKIIDSTKRNIQTMRLKIEKLEKYMAEKLAKLESPVFEKAELEHMFGIDKIVKERASGAFDAGYKGYHHDKGWKLVKKGKVKFLTEPEVCPKTGIVYVEKVSAEGIILKQPKTFFPPEWSRHKVIDKIVEASQNIVDIETHGLRTATTGLTNEQMKILMIIDQNRKLVTAYPIS